MRFPNVFDHNILLNRESWKTNWGENWFLVSEEKLAVTVVWPFRVQPSNSGMVCLASILGSSPCAS